MIVEGRKMKCDSCGKETEWVQTDPGLTPSGQLRDSKWKHITVGYDITGTQQKNFCSSQCVKDYLDRVDDPNPRSKNISTEEL